MKYSLVVQWMGERGATYATGRTYKDILNILDALYGVAMNESVVSIEVKMEGYDDTPRTSGIVSADATGGYWAGVSSPVST